MMELSHSLLLNEQALAQIPEQKKPLFIHEWLRFLDRVLPVAQKSDIKGCQQKLVEQLTNQISTGTGPPTRKLLAQCLATLFSVGDTFSLFQTINACNDILRNKDDSPSFLPSKLSAVCVLGAMYEKLGRMVGRTFEETAQILVRSLKNAESQGRVEIALTLEKMVNGLGSGGNSVHKEIYKATKLMLIDRVMAVRCAACSCMEALVREASFVYTQELDTVSAACFKALEGSNYDVRCSVAKLLGLLLAVGHNPKILLPPGAKPQTIPVSASGQNVAGATGPKTLALDDCWNILGSGFLRGGVGYMKGGSASAASIPKEIRIGVTMAYIEFVATSGGQTWLERNAPAFIGHVLDMAASAGKTGANVNAVEIVYIRRCVCFVLRSTVGRWLSEKAECNVAKELGRFIAEQMSQLDLSMEAGLDRPLSVDATAFQHSIACALQELSSLVGQVGTAVAPLFTEASGIMEPVFAVLLHPALQCRLAAAWCLRCVATAVPSLLTPLLDRCINRLEHQKTSPDGISGYAFGLSALLSAVHQCPLGIPQNKGKQIFALAEELLRSAPQTGRLTLSKTQAGWVLLSGVMALGSAVVKHHLPRMIMLWKNAFPRSSKEAEAEKQRGDAYTWSITLESRAGAFAAMQAFFVYCKELVNDEVIRRILIPLDAALTMLGVLPQIVKQYGNQVKTGASVVRYRMYNALLQLNSPKQYESCFAQLLREVVAEFTLTDNMNVIPTSILGQLCHQDDSIIMGSWLQETDHRAIEEQLTPAHQAGAGALEHDPMAVCLRIESLDSHSCLPNSTAVIDSSIQLYGALFPWVPTKHRLQMLEHFNECIKQAKGPRQQAIQVNVLTALLCSLKSMADQKSMLDNEGVLKAVLNLILAPLSSNSAILRCAGAEALGRAAQVVSDPKFVADMAQFIFDKLKTCRDVVSRTGHSLALGCLHRYVGGLGSGQHLNTSVGILLALSQDQSSPVVQVWALHALGLIADSGGPMFRSYVEPTLGLCLKLLLSTPPTVVDVSQCVGKLVSALITTVGPELQNNIGNIVSTRSNFLAAVALMIDHADPLVQAQAVSSAQQLHLFAPRHVNLSSLVPQLCLRLSQPHLILRKAAVACLRQLVQREAKEVREHAQTLAPQGMTDKKASVLPETGLEGALFAMMDVETDPSIVSNLRETVTSLVQSLAGENLAHWLYLCKDILASTSSDLLSPQGDDRTGKAGSSAAAAAAAASSDGDGQDELEEEGLRTGVQEPEPSGKILPRWPTRVFACDIVRKIIGICENERAHFDLALAKELQLSGGRSDYLVLHLSDLIRMSFMAATSDSNELRMAGLACLQDVIAKFAKVPEPEFPGHVILEQFQAQVGAALRPAFAPETPSHVTAAACQTCSAWIGSGVARDLNDLRRVHQLLVSSLAKLKKGSISSQLYNESAATLEKLAILKAWAEVYIVAMKQEEEIKERQRQHQQQALSQRSGQQESVYSEELQDSTDLYPSESLLQLVTPELATLVSHWLAALRDHALLSLPTEFGPQLPPDGGSYYTPETVEIVRPYYKQSWPPILLAAATWLKHNDFELPTMALSAMSGDGDGESPTDGAKPTKSSSVQQQTKDAKPETKDDRFSLILGICMEALCSPRSSENAETIQMCLETLKTVLESEWAQLQLTSDPQLAVETLNVMHRLILTRESLQIQALCIEIVKEILTAAERSAAMVVEAEDDEGVEADSKDKIPAAQYRGREGGETGKLEIGHSIVYAALEVCLCLLVRQVPQVNPAVAKSKSALLAHKKYYHRPPSIESQQLIAASIQCMVRLPSLCGPRATIVVLPTILFLLIGALKECSKIERSPFIGPPATSSTGNGPPSSSSASTSANGLGVGQITIPAAASLQALRTMISRPLTVESNDNRLDPAWVKTMQAALWTILSLENSENGGDAIVDKTAIMLAVAVFLVTAPRQVIALKEIEAACIHLFEECLNDPTPLVRIKCLQTLQSVFGHKDLSISVPYIHSLTPAVVAMLRKHGGGNDEEEDSVENVAKKDIENAGKEKNGIHTRPMITIESSQLPVLIEAERALEVLVGVAREDKRLPLLALVVHILMSFIRDPQTAASNNDSQRPPTNAATKQLHDYSLQRLNILGPYYPHDFKTILSQLPDVKSRLERAVRSQHQQSASAAAAAATAAAGARGGKQGSSSNAQPSIKLTTDFSNFVRS